MNRFAIATGGYQPSASNARWLIAVEGYWRALVSVGAGSMSLGLELTIT